MEQTKEQKLLGTFGTIALVFGLIGLLASVGMLFFGGAALGNADTIINESSATAEDLGKVSGVFLFTGLATLSRSIFNFINWICLKRVSKDATKYKGAQTVTLITLVLSAAGLLGTLLSKSNSLQTIAGSAVGVLFNGYIYALVMKVKKLVTG